MRGIIVIIENDGKSGAIQYDECVIFAKKDGAASYYTIPDMSEEETDAFLFSVIRNKNEVAE